MKNYWFVLCCSCNFIIAQNNWPNVPISETVSSNSRFTLKSISWDNEYPTSKGRSVVYDNHSFNKNGQKTILYEIERSFDLYDKIPYFSAFLAISNDGKKVAYFKNVTFSDGEEQKNITYYVNGKLMASYDYTDFIGCDENEEICRFFYPKGFDETHLVDYSKTTGTIKVYKKGIDEKEKFLLENYIFNYSDTIYITDSRKKATLFDLNNNKIIKNNIEFDSIYPKIKDFHSIKSHISYYRYAIKNIPDIQNAATNEKLSETISKMENLKFISMNDPTFYDYKLYKIKLSGYLNKSGKFEIEELECDSVFEKKKIEAYLTSTIFKANFLPEEVDKQYYNHFYGGYRSYDENKARLATQKAKEQKMAAFKSRLDSSEINGVYIPKNLYECMIELDEILNFKTKKQLKENEIRYNSHLSGLGIWIRNNWGINNGSRLLNYFYQRGIGKGPFDSDKISEIIVNSYIQWLKGDEKIWRKWESENPVKKE